jgi:arylsulfatase A-like enzyme
VKPNILYLHCHDAGRYIEPYGHRIPTPHLQRLAEQGVLFHNAFSAGPTCSPSRAALLTGQSPHNAGMLGLAHFGWRLSDSNQHLIHCLHEAGYTSVLCGEQHLTEYRPRATSNLIGYHRVLRPALRELVRERRARRRRRRRRRRSERAGSHPPGDARVRDVARRRPDRFGAAVRVTHDRGVARAAAQWLQSAGQEQPFFMSVGFVTPHRVYARAQPAAHPAEDARFVRPPAALPDVPEVRRDMANYVASVRTMDACCGAVLNALEESGLAENTLVVATTDHGIAFPMNKCTLTDRGLGVYLILRGPGGFRGGKAIEGMVSQIDLYPTLCELLDIEAPHWLQGESLLPLLSGERSEIHDALYGEVTYHAAYEPMRSIRTHRFKYIRRFDPERNGPVLPNCDNGPSKRYLLRHGWATRTPPVESLFDLAFDPNETQNLASDAAYAEIKADLAARLQRWMERTGDPLLLGPVAPPRRQNSAARRRRSNLESDPKGSAPQV